MAFRILGVVYLGDLMLAFCKMVLCWAVDRIVLASLLLPAVWAPALQRDMNNETIAVIARLCG